jgi:lipase chaperone LimK
MTEPQPDYDTIAQTHGNAAAKICRAIDERIAALGDQAPPRLAEIRREAAQGNYSQYFSARYRVPMAALVQALVDCGQTELYQRALMGEFNADRAEFLKYRNMLAGGPVYGDKTRKGRRVRVK